MSNENEEQFNVHQRSLHNVVFRSMKRAHDMFLHNYEVYPENLNKAYVFFIFTNFFIFSERIWRNTKIKSDFLNTIKAVETAKKKKIDDVLKLPKPIQNNIESSGNESKFII